MNNVVILADGEFPEHPSVVKLLESSDAIVCCDGAAENLITFGIVPYAIVGDMDSLSTEMQLKYQALIHADSDQETNDLTKAFHYTLSLNPGKITILGATGAREDHTLGNISLIADYIKMSDAEVEMHTNFGKFIAINKKTTLMLPVGSQISVFAIDTNIRIKSKGLKYKLDSVVFDSWWKGTLNETTEESISLDFESGRVILYIAY
ncbi:MAG: thiamine diphosphokinase [Bacteroidetes bacterium GWF2_40_14]|nr:MAG: thiamine diphosphokinase [Bacteroidetes bacterium GWF2_40_14]